MSWRMTAAALSLPAWLCFRSTTCRRTRHQMRGNCTQRVRVQQQQQQQQQQRPFRLLTQVLNRDRGRPRQRVLRQAAGAARGAAAVAAPPRQCRLLHMPFSSTTLRSNEGLSQGSIHQVAFASIGSPCQHRIRQRKVGTALLLCQGHEVV